MEDSQISKSKGHLSRSKLVLKVKPAGCREDYESVGLVPIGWLAIVSTGYGYGDEMK